MKETESLEGVVGHNCETLSLGWCREREKIDWQEARKFDCRLVRTIFIFVVPRKFSLDAGEWPENQILIPDWTNFHCPGATLLSHCEDRYSGAITKGQAEVGC